jgi:hypothetical protein
MAEIVVNVSVSGGPDMQTAVENALKAFSADLTGPLIEEAETIMAASHEIVPVDSGDLQDSGDVVGINVVEGSGTIDVIFGYGGLAASYAVKQHETPPSIFHHDPPTMWKYLERPVYEAAEGLGARLAAKIRSRFQGGGGDGATFEGS